VASLAPVSAKGGLGGSGRQRWRSPFSSTSLVYTADGGQSWQQRDDPCATTGFVGLWSVHFARASAGCVLCTAQAATNLQPKALFSRF
jgi:hypothetical protein